MSTATAPKTNGSRHASDFLFNSRKGTVVPKTKPADEVIDFEAALSDLPEPEPLKSADTYPRQGSSNTYSESKPTSPVESTGQVEGSESAPEHPDDYDYVTMELEIIEPIGDRVHEAFEHVAMWFACTLSALLDETRARGIADDEVREVLEAEERRQCHQDGTPDNALRCRINDAGQFYIVRNEGVNDGPASFRELFAEFEATNRFSDEFREGHDLTTIEATMLDVAQTINRKFARGTSVPLKAVFRIMRQYHRSLVDGFTTEDLKRVTHQLEARGIVIVSPANIRLATVAKPSQLSRIGKLADGYLQRAFLEACNACCGIAWNNGNVAARAAVVSLLQARFEISKALANKTARELIAAGIIEEVPSKGTTAFRLTPQHHARNQKPKTTDSEEPTNNDERQPPSHLSDNAAGVWRIAHSIEQLGYAHLGELLVEWTKQGGKGRAFKVAVAELLAVELAFLVDEDSTMFLALGDALYATPEMFEAFDFAAKFAENGG